MKVQLMCQSKLLSSIMLNIDDKDNENTFRDGGSTALKIADTVYTIDTDHMAYTVHTAPDCASSGGLFFIGSLFVVMMYLRAGISILPVRGRNHPL